MTPAVDATAYLLTGNDVDAYRLIQAINVVVMVSAAFPAYLLAKRALSHRGALAVAALAVLVPWMVYARFVMTEAAFYPVFLLFGLALVRALERPSVRRQLVLALALALAFATRTQAVALAGAVVSAVVLHGLARGRPSSDIRAFAPTWALYAAAGAGAAVMAAAGIWRPLGAYSVLLRESWHPHGIVLWLAAHVTSLTLGLGVLVVVAAPLGAAALLNPRAEAHEQAFAAAAVSSTLWLLLTVAVLSVTPYGEGTVHERSLFFVTPFVLICAFAWAERGFPRPLLLTSATVAGLVILAILMPSGVITTHSIDALSFKLWAEMPREGYRRRRCSSWPSQSAQSSLSASASPGRSSSASSWRPLGVAAASDYRSEQPRSLTQRYAWIDRTLPVGARAAILWIGLDEGRCPPGAAGSLLGKVALYTEFFNSRIGPVGHLLGDNADRGLATDTFGIRRDGVVTRAGIAAPPRLRRHGRPGRDRRVPVLRSCAPATWVSLMHARTARWRSGAWHRHYASSSPRRPSHPQQHAQRSRRCPPTVEPSLRRSTPSPRWPGPT